MRTYLLPINVEPDEEVEGKLVRRSTYARRLRSLLLPS